MFHFFWNCLKRAEFHKDITVKTGLLQTLREIAISINTLSDTWYNDKVCGKEKFVSYYLQQQQQLYLPHLNS